MTPLHRVASKGVLPILWMTVLCVAALHIGLGDSAAIINSTGTADSAAASTSPLLLTATAATTNATSNQFQIVVKDYFEDGRRPVDAQHTATNNKAANDETTPVSSPATVSTTKSSSKCVYDVSEI